LMGGASILIPIWWFYTQLRYGMWQGRNASSVVKEYLPKVISEARNTLSDMKRVKVCVPRTLLNPAPPVWAQATFIIVIPKPVTAHKRAQILTNVLKGVGQPPPIQVLIAAEGDLKHYSRMLGPLECVDVQGELQSLNNSQARNFTEARDTRRTGPRGPE